MNSEDTSKKSITNLLSNGIVTDKYIKLEGGIRPGRIDFIMARKDVGKPIFLNVEGDHGEENKHGDVANVVNAPV